MYKLTKLKNGLTVKFSASFEGIDSVCMDLKLFLSENGLGDLCFDLTLGLREALSNAVRHGSHMDPEKEVFCSIEADVAQIRIRVADRGAGFDWRRMEKKRALPAATDGRGMSILEHYFDAYRFNESGNEVELVKKI